MVDLEVQTKKSFVQQKFRISLGVDHLKTDAEKRRLNTVVFYYCV